jgi:trimethylguanosine synthase
MSNGNPFSAKMQKYWDRRYDLFSLWDEGIKFDEQALYSIKPEKSAKEILQKVRTEIIVDAMACVGGTAIAAAMLGFETYAIELNSQRLDFAKHNAQIYGIGSHINWIEGNCLIEVPRLAKSLNKSQTLYLDPPWGGVDYYLKEKFKLSDFSPDITELANEFLTDYGDVVLSVPPNFDLDEIKKISSDYHKTQSTLWNKIICINFYFKRD